MKIDRLIQSILLAMVIVGVFAAMARNAYGFTLIGLACFGLAILYVILVVWSMVADRTTLDKKLATVLVERLLIAAFLLLFGFRAFYIYIPGGEFIFLTICVLLSLDYVLLSRAIFNDVKKTHPGLAWNILFLHASIVLFLLSIATRVFTAWSSLAGALGILIAIPFAVAVLTNRKYEIGDKKTTLFKFVVASENKAGLLYIFFLSSVLYVSLVYTNTIPAIENAAQPKTYIELISDAERGREKPVDGKFKHEIYKEAMDRFMKRHGNK